MDSKQCLACGYERGGKEASPSWQCPCCDRAYNKLTACFLWTQSPKKIDEIPDGFTKGFHVVGLEELYIVDKEKGVRQLQVTADKIKKILALLKIDLSAVNLEKDLFFDINYNQLKIIQELAKTNLFDFDFSRKKEEVSKKPPEIIIEDTCNNDVTLDQSLKDLKVIQQLSYLLYDRYLWIGLLGSMLVFIGLFLPILNLPIYGNVNFFAFMSHSTDKISVFCLIFGFAARLFFKGRWVPFLFALLILMGISMEFYDYYYRLSTIRNELQMENGIGGAFALAMMSNVGLKWGWLPLFAGAILMLYASIIKNKEDVPFIVRRLNKEQQKKLVLFSWVAPITLLILLFAPIF